MLSNVFEASQIDVSLHSPALLELLEIKVSRTLIDYLVECTYETVDFALGRPSSSQGRTRARSAERAAFTRFVSQVLERAAVKVPVILVTLVYIHRAKPELEIALEQWACERVFLGALILANKFLNDSTLKNVHWARCTGVFRVGDIGRIEREFLEVLSFDLNITEDDILSHHESIMTVINPNHNITRPSSLFARVAKRFSWDSEESTLGESTPSTETSSTSIGSSLSGEPQKSQDGISTAPAEGTQFQLTPPPAYSHHDPNPQSTAPSSRKSNHRFSSALHALRSIPISIPNFHSSPGSNSASSPASSCSDADSDSGCSPKPHSASNAAHHKSTSHRSGTSSPSPRISDNQPVRVSVLPVPSERCRPVAFQRVSSHLIVGHA